MVDKKIADLAGRNNPFKVPDGYFAQLQKEIMGRLPERPVIVQAPRDGHWFLRPIIGIAASACLAIAGISVYSGNAGLNGMSSDNGGILDKISVSDNVSDYINVDNEDIYRYMIEKYME